MIRLVQYHTWQQVRGGHNSSFRTALVKTRGKKWLQVVALDASQDGGLRVWKVPVSDARYMTPLLFRGKPYPMSRALKTFRSLAATHGITKGARKILKEASSEIKTNKNLGGESTAASPGVDA